METNLSPTAVAALGDMPAPGAGSITTIAEDRLEGAEAIGRFIDPTKTEREIRRLLVDGHYPCWREGRIYVASKSALLRHWCEKTAQVKPQPAARQLKNKSARRGYLGVT
jgi:hypothetical protein